ncbi:MAG: type I methionyl aminopeptidase [Spirochaetaceae bacterium]|nr:MAG: type I methionyl aminopeptidase [Spirochaetaceae bacterium]
MKLKNPAQIEKIRESGKVLARTLDRLGRMVAVGVTPLDIDAECRRLLKEAGATPAFLGYMGFPASICVSVNEQVIHGIPNRRKFRSGDIVSLDIGVDLDGYISDSAATFPVGSVAPEIRRLLTETRRALELGIAAARPRGRVHDISRAIYRHVTQFGYGVVRPYCGHGVGFSVHEEPQVPNYVSAGPNPRLKPGMVLAVEPMVNLGGDDVSVLDDDWTVVTDDGSISAHFEHTIAVLDDRVEILTLLDTSEPLIAGAAL